MTRAAVIAALAFFPASAHAACMPRAVMIERLADRYGEGRESVALDASGRMVETFANIETGSWTVAVTLPNGIACLIASGQSYERVREAPVTGERS
jgi:hypothetical protein